MLHLGFKWKTSSKNGKVLMEQYRLRVWRYKFLKQLKLTREEGRTLVYLDESTMRETWFNVGESASKIWTDDSLQATQKAPVSRGEHT